MKTEVETEKQTARNDADSNSNEGNPVGQRRRGANGGYEEKSKAHIIWVRAQVLIVIFSMLAFVFTLVGIAIHQHEKNYAAPAKNKIVKILNSNHKTTGVYPKNRIDLKNLLDKQDVEFKEKTTIEYTSNERGGYSLFVANDFGAHSEATAQMETTKNE